jgi:hypothetical protein
MLVWLFTLYCMLVGIVFAHFLNGAQYMLQNNDAGSVRTYDRSGYDPDRDDGSQYSDTTTRASSRGSTAQSMSRQNSAASLLSDNASTHSRNKLSDSVAGLVDAANTPADLHGKDELMLCKVFLRGHIDIPTNRQTTEKPYALSDDTYTICEQLYAKNSETLTKANHDILDIFGASYNDRYTKWWGIIIHVIAKDYKSVPYTGIICLRKETEQNIFILYNCHFYKNYGYINNPTELSRMPPAPVCIYNQQKDTNTCHNWK